MSSLAGGETRQRGSAKAGLLESSQGRTRGSGLDVGAFRNMMIDVVGKSHSKIKAKSLQDPLAWCRTRKTPSKPKRSGIVVLPLMVGLGD